MKNWSIKTKEGCCKWLSFLLIVILLCSFMAHVVATNFGKVRIEEIQLDVRGAVLDADIYTPAKVSDKDSLPGVVLFHGGGSSKHILKPMAEELSRRGYVVLSVSAYGDGMSEQPLYDELGYGVEEYYVGSTVGYLDAVNYLRSVTYVDETRIAVVGQSRGAQRASNTTVVDVGYYNLNDLMVNVLYETFGQRFTEEEINQDADALAVERLNDDQLAHYEYIKTEKEAYYNSRIKVAVLLDTLGVVSSENALHAQNVQVGGHEVQRNVQANVCVVGGEWDFINNMTHIDENIINSMYITEESVPLGTWYNIDDMTQTSRIIGDIATASVADSEEFAAAADNRTLRVVNYYTGMSHSREELSSTINTAVVSVLENTLGFNMGDTTDSSTVPLDASSNIWYWRIIFLAISMCAMFALMIPIIALLLRTKFFNPCKIEKLPDSTNILNRKAVYGLNIITILFVFYNIMRANKGTAFFGFDWMAFFKNNNSFPLFASYGNNLNFLFGMTLFSIITLIVFSSIKKKKDGHYGLKELFGPNIVIILKSILIGVIFLAFAYTLCVLVNDMFGEDFRFWLLVYTKMQPEKWGVFIRYALMLFPCFVLMSASTNLTVRDDLSEGKDLLYCVLINTGSIVVCYIINVVFLLTKGTAFSDFMSTHALVFSMPVMVATMRYSYRKTRQIWIGAALCTLLMVWSITSGMGMTAAYAGSTFSEIFFGIIAK